MCEQNNQVIITLIVINTFVSLILDCNKNHTILKLIQLALKWFIDEEKTKKTGFNKVG